MAVGIALASVDAPSRPPKRTSPSPKRFAPLFDVSDDDDPLTRINTPGDFMFTSRVTPAGSRVLASQRAGPRGS